MLLPSIKSVSIRGNHGVLDGVAARNAATRCKTRAHPSPAPVLRGAGGDVVRLVVFHGPQVALRGDVQHAVGHHQGGANLRAQADFGQELFLPAGRQRDNSFPFPIGRSSQFPWSAPITEGYLRRLDLPPPPPPAVTRMSPRQRKPPPIG